MSRRDFATVFRYEARGRLRTSLLLSGALSAYGLVFVALAPDLLVGTDLAALLESLPPLLTALVGFASLDWVAGLLASEFDACGWTVGLAAYVAYAAAGTGGGDIESGRAATLLSGPTARTDVLAGVAAGLLVPIGLVNAIVPLALYLGAGVIGQPLSLAGLYTLHAVAVVYLLAWLGLGTLVGVTVKRGRLAGRTAIAGAFAAWFGEAALSVTTVSELGALSPARYFDPTAVLVEGIIAPLDIAVLLAIAVLALSVARYRFVRTDL